MNSDENNYKTSSTFASFLRGLGSILNIWPAPTPIARRNRKSVADAWAEDSRKLAGDWDRATNPNEMENEP